MEWFLIYIVVVVLLFVGLGYVDKKYPGMVVDNHFKRESDLTFAIFGIFTWPIAFPLFGLFFLGIILFSGGQWIAQNVQIKKGNQ